MRQPLRPRLRGVFIVTWRVLADDGHLSTGEFAFAVGRTGGLPSASSATTARTPWQQVAFSLLFFVGLDLALGGIASERVIWKSAPGKVRRPPVGAGLMLASAGAAGQLIQVAGERAGGGFSAGLRSSAVASAIGTRPGLLTLAVIAILLLASASTRLRALRLLAPIALVGAVVATSLRSHAWSSGPAWAVTADVIHLTGAAIWVGALAHLVVVTAASEPDRRGRSWASASGATPSRRYPSSSSSCSPACLARSLSSVRSASWRDRVRTYAAHQGRTRRARALGDAVHRGRRARVSGRDVPDGLSRPPLLSRLNLSFFRLI